MRYSFVSIPAIVDGQLLPALKEDLKIVDDDSDDELLKTAGRVMLGLQERTRRQFLTATLEARFDRFPAAGCWELPIAPLVSVQTVKYLDDAPTLVTWDAANYEVITDSEPGLVRLEYEKTYPSFARNIVTAYTAGYGTLWTDLAENVQDCILLAVNHRWHNRNGEPPPKGLIDLITQLTVGDEFSVDADEGGRHPFSDSYATYY